MHSSGHGNSNKGTNDENDTEVMVTKSKHWDSKVGKDEIFTKKIQRFK